MLDEEGAVKLIDFGIAAPALRSRSRDPRLARHMPPEQVEGKELGPATDIFAVAVLLMEAWSGVPPFRRATPDECDDAMRNPHPRPSDYDPRLIPLDDVIVRAMKLDPKERQQDAADVARALRAFLRDRPRRHRRVTRRSRPRSARAASEPNPDVARPAPVRSIRASATWHEDVRGARRGIRWSRPPSSEVEPPGAPPES